MFISLSQKVKQPSLRGTKFPRRVFFSMLLTYCCEFLGQPFWDRFSETNFPWRIFWDDFLGWIFLDKFSGMNLMGWILWDDFSGMNFLEWIFWDEFDGLNFFGHIIWSSFSVINCLITRTYVSAKSNYIVWKCWFMFATKSKFKLVENCFH